MRITKLFNDFFNSEKTGGLLLIACTVISMLLANSSWQADYLRLWEYEFQGHSIAHWINDGLMSIFFLLIGLELEREIYKGELSNVKNALLPVIAAVGGVLVPAGIYTFFNYGSITQSGAGIPMATDIAFSIGVLSLLGSKVPASLKIFLTALAVIDDLCAILVIAIFYTAGISITYLLITLGVFIVLLIMNRTGIRNMVPYIIGGILMWYCMMHSGVHATLSGVLLAFAIPFGDGEKKSTSYLLQHALHKPVAFIILPLFALANTCIVFQQDWTNGLLADYTIGIYAGLLAGKPVGILLFCGIAVATGICNLPAGLQWKHIFGAGLLAGIGFTMSIFVTLLAFADPHLISNSKIAIIFGSLSAGIFGLIYLALILKKEAEKDIVE